MAFNATMETDIDVAVPEGDDSDLHSESGLLAEGAPAPIVAPQASRKKYVKPGCVSSTDKDTGNLIRQSTEPPNLFDRLMTVKIEGDLFPLPESEYLDTAFTGGGAPTKRAAATKSTCCWRRPEQAESRKHPLNQSLSANKRSRGSRGGGRGQGGPSTAA